MRCSVKLGNIASLFVQMTEAQTSRDHPEGAVAARHALSRLSWPLCCPLFGRLLLTGLFGLGGSPRHFETWRIFLVLLNDGEFAVRCAR